GVHGAACLEAVDSRDLAGQRDGGMQCSTCPHFEVGAVLVPLETANRLDKIPMQADARTVDDADALCCTTKVVNIGTVRRPRIDVRQRRAWGLLDRGAGHHAS